MGQGTEGASVRYMPPVFAQLLGALCEAGRLADREVAESLARLEDERGKTVQRYFDGEKKIGDENERQILMAFGAALSESGLLGEWFRGFVTACAEEAGMSRGELVGGVLMFTGRKWDELVWDMARGAAVREARLGARPFVRLAVIDLSLRWAALSLLEGWPVAEGRPAWGKEVGKGGRLAELLKACGEGKPTRDGLSEKTGVSVSTVGRWLDEGLRPLEGNVVSLAEVLGEHLGREAKDVLGELRRYYAMRALAEGVAAVVGWEETGRAAEKLAELAKRIRGRLGSLAEEALWVAVTFGLGRPEVASVLLPALAEEETDGRYATMLAAMASGKLVEHLWHCTARLANTREVFDRMSREGIFSRSSDAEAMKLVEYACDAGAVCVPPKLRKGGPEGYVTYRLVGDAATKAGNRMEQGKAAAARGDYREAVVHYRRAVELTPLDATARYLYGAALWQAGDERGGLGECWVAHKLRSEWDRPYVEVAIIHARHGRFAEAAKHLDELPAEMGETPYLLRVRGAARCEVGRYREGLADAERVIAAEPRNGPAYETAARCAFAIGGRELKTKGANYAKAASLNGCPEAYRRWRAGEFG